MTLTFSYIGIPPFKSFIGNTRINKMLLDKNKIVDKQRNSLSDDFYTLSYTRLKDGKIFRIKRNE